MKPEPITMLGWTKDLVSNFEKYHDVVMAALAYAGGTHTKDDVFHMCLTGRARLWPLANSFMITEILDYPRAKHYHIFLAGGELSELIDMEHELLAAAREANCSKLTASGRRGFIKALKTFGCVETQAVCEREV